jgi:hypothetical protein
VVNGDLLIATARNPEQLGDLVSTYGERILTVALDVTNPEQARAAIALLVIRGAPALLYRRQAGMRRAVVAGLLQAISLPSMSSLACRSPGKVAFQMAAALLRSLALRSGSSSIPTQCHLRFYLC